MRWFVFYFALALSLAFTQATAEDNFEICYFDLSGQPDSDFLKKNLKGVIETNGYEKTGDTETFKINGEITIRASTPEKNENINQAFEEWVRENKDKNCSGLIFSGYHTGGHFHQEGGETTDQKNKLSLSLIEKLACDKEFKSWFKNVKQLWLFGSYTVNDEYLHEIRGKIAEEKLIDERKAETKTGDKLATPLTKPKTDGEHTYANLQKMGLSFAHALDEGTPLSSRYMRAFPNTNIYGWHDEAPTSHQIKDEWGGTHPIFNHIKHIGQANTASGSASTETDKDIIIKGINLLAEGDFCDTQWENITEQKGVATGGVEKKNYGQAAKLGCDLINAQKAMNNAKEKCNQDHGKPGLTTKAQRNCEQKALREAKNEIMKTLKEINKLEKELAEARKDLTDTDNDADAQQTVKEIIGEAGLKDKTLSLSHLLFNEIDSAYLTARKHIRINFSEKEIEKHLNEFKKELNPGSPIIKALREKVESPVLSTVRKVDYIGFYKLLHGDTDSFVKDSVQTIIDDKLKCAYWKKKSNGSCPDRKVAQVTTEKNGTTTTRTLSTNDSLLAAGRGEDKITPEHHYTLTAVVSDQLKQYSLLNTEQSQELGKILTDLQKTDNPNPYIKQIAHCITADDWRAFRECKKAN